MPTLVSLPWSESMLFLQTVWLSLGEGLEHDECDAFDRFPIVSFSAHSLPFNSLTVLTAHHCLSKTTVHASFGLRYSSALVLLCFGMDPQLQVSISIAIAQSLNPLCLSMVFQIGKPCCSKQIVKPCMQLCREYLFPAHVSLPQCLLLWTSWLPTSMLVFGDFFPWDPRNYLRNSCCMWKNCHLCDAPRFLCTSSTCMGKMSLCLFFLLDVVGPRHSFSQINPPLLCIGCPLPKALFFTALKCWSPYQSWTLFGCIVLVQCGVKSKVVCSCSICSAAGVSICTICPTPSSFESTLRRSH